MLSLIVQEEIKGTVMIDTASAMSHSGITLKVEGTLKLQLSARSVGLFEAFYSSIKPMPLMRCVVAAVVAAAAAACAARRARGVVATRPGGA